MRDGVAKTRTAVVKHRGCPHLTTVEATRPVQVTDKWTTVMVNQTVSDTRQCSRCLVAFSTRTAGIFLSGRTSRHEAAKMRLHLQA